MEKLDLNVKQGAKYNAKIYVTDDGEDPINLSGYSLSGAVKYRYGNSGFYYNLAPTVDNGPSGIIDLTISPAYTIDFPIGEATYEIKRFDGQGNAERTVYGNFNVFPSVSRSASFLSFPDDILDVIEDQDYSNYIAALENPSSGNLSLSTLQKNSVSTFISGAKYDDFWSNMVSLYVLSWNSYGAKAINLVNPLVYNMTFTNYGALTSGYLQNDPDAYAVPDGLYLSGITRGDALSFGLGVSSNANEGFDFGDVNVAFKSRDIGDSALSSSAGYIRANSANSSGQWDVITYSTGAAYRKNGIVQAATTNQPNQNLSSGTLSLGKAYPAPAHSSRRYTYFMIGSGFGPQMMDSFNERIEALLSNI